MSVIYILASGACHLAPYFKDSVSLTHFFNDGEIFVDQSYPVSPCLVQSLMSHDAIIEMQMILAFSPVKMPLILPYCAYTRHPAAFDAIMAPVINQATAVTFVDIHDQACLDHVSVPVTQLSFVTTFGAMIRERPQDYHSDLCVIVSPDKGAYERGQCLADYTELPHIPMTKQRTTAGKIIHMTHQGSVTGKHCLIIDDMIDTGHTITEAAWYLKAQGATKVSVFATHGLFSKAFSVDIFDSIVVSDTLLCPLKHPRIQVIHGGSLLFF